MAASASYSSEGDDSLITDINVTPLVDVVLVLLIVFMITMPTIVSMDLMNERELSVVLPEAGAAKPLIAVPQELFVNVDVQGNYSVHRQPQTLDSLRGLLAQTYADNPGRATVVIRADKQCRWQYVVAVMNLCNEVKIRDYRVSTSE